MPVSVVYLLILLGAILVIRGFSEPQRVEFAVKKSKLRIQDWIHIGLHQYRRGGIVLGAMIIGLGVYGSSASLPESKAPEPTASFSTADVINDYRKFESDSIQIDLPGGWTAIDVLGLDISDLDLSEFPRPVQRSISAIPIGNEELQLFAFDTDYQATLIIMSGGLETTSVSTLLDRRESLYNWIGVPVTAAQAGLMINGMNAGTLVTEPIHRYELFREKQYLVTAEKKIYVMIFSTLAHNYQDRESGFEEIASSFQVLAGV